MFLDGIFRRFSIIPSDSELVERYAAQWKADNSDRDTYVISGDGPHLLAQAVANKAPNLLQNAFIAQPLKDGFGYIETNLTKALSDMKRYNRPYCICFNNRYDRMTFATQIYDTRASLRAGNFTIT